MQVFVWRNIHEKLLKAVCFLNSIVTSSITAGIGADRVQEHTRMTLQFIHSLEIIPSRLHVHRFQPGIAYTILYAHFFVFKPNETHQNATRVPHHLNPQPDQGLGGSASPSKIYYLG